MKILNCMTAVLGVVLSLVSTGCELTTEKEPGSDAGTNPPMRRKLMDVLGVSGDDSDAGIIVLVDAGGAGRAAGGAGGMTKPPGHEHPQAGHAGQAGQAGQAGSPPTQPVMPMTPAAVSFSVPLTKDEETPPCDAAGANASAIGSLSISADGSAVSVQLSYSGLSGDPSYAHIHLGAKGVAGPVMLDLGTSLSSPIRKTFKAADFPAPPNGPADFAALVEAIKAGQTYFNLHTMACGAGELRGQIDAMDKDAQQNNMFHAKLTAAQGVPLCAQPAQAALGMGTLTISPNHDSIAIRLNFSGLSGAPVAGHVHLGTPGVAGPVLLSLGNLPRSTQVFSPSDYVPPDNGPKDFAALIEVIRAGQSYFNIHTDACTDGEVRGQILGEEQAWSFEPSEFQTRVTPSAEIPACAAAAPNAIGIGALVISPDETQVAISLAHNGLSGAPTMAHIHFGASDATGPVVVNLGSELKSPIHKVITGADYIAPSDGQTDFASLIEAIREGRTYFNVHTTACAAGELRGQITP